MEGETLYNELVLSHHGGDILYRGSKLKYKCCCGDRPHFLGSHALWARHFALTYNLPYLLRCSICNKDFATNIRSLAQHFPRCKARSASQRANMVTQSQATQVACALRTVECSYCDLRARNKRGLMRHIHRRHPQQLYDMFLEKRLVDKRWSRCEEKVLFMAMSRLLKAKGLPPSNASICANMKECFMNCKSKLDKSYKQVRKSLVSNEWQHKFEMREERHAQRRLEHVSSSTDQLASVETERHDGNSCQCLHLIREGLKSRLTSDESLSRLDRPTKVTIKRELNPQSPRIGAMLLGVIYKRYGEKTDSKGSGDVARHTLPRSNRNRSDDVDTDQLFRTLGAKDFVNDLCNPGLRHLVPNEEAIEFFGSAFERMSIEDDEAYSTLQRDGSTCSIHGMITDTECELHVKSFSKDTACGTDRFTTVHLKLVPISLLTILMNLFLLEGDVPSALKVNRTTLLAKKPNPGPSEWRPITVSSVLYRLFSKIITARLTAEIYLSPHQRAFRPGIDGCMENASTIAELIKRANAGIGPLFCCSLDLAKAFDSVSFTSIVRMLKRQKIDNISLRLLTNMLYNNTTLVSGSREAKITRGVRQGDPVSPLLFNAVIDELFPLLRNKRYGAKFETRTGFMGKIVAVAFADDITLLCNSQRHLEKLLKISTRFFKRRGMRININKSSCLAIRRIPCSDICTPLPVTIEVEDPESGSKECLPCIRPSDDLRILGTYVTPTGKPHLQKERLIDLLKKVEASDLSAFYKVALIRDHIVNKFRFQAVYGNVGQVAARSADKLIRTSLRRILDLATHTAKSFYHLPRSHGGLGIESIDFAARYLRVKLELKLLHSDRAATRECVVVATLRDKYVSACRDLRLLTDEEASDWTAFRSNVLLAQKLVEIDYEKWYELCRLANIDLRLSAIRRTVQGAAFDYLTGAPYEYLVKPNKYDLQLCKFPMIYRQRLGMDRVLSNLRGSSQTAQLLSCRLCTAKSETPQHVLQQCLKTKRWRIERHNAIVDLMYRMLVSKLNGDRNLILKEQEFVLLSSEESSQVRLKPDITVVCRNNDRDQRLTKICIIDVACVYEVKSGNSLDTVYVRKCQKYNALKAYLISDNNLEILRQSTRGACQLAMVPETQKDMRISFEVHPLIVGARGGWQKRNKDIFKFLVLGKVDKVLVNRVMRTVAERTINIFKKFMGKVRADG